MGLASGIECAPPARLKFSTDTGSEFYAAVLEVYHTGLALTAEQQAIAAHWAEGREQQAPRPANGSPSWASWRGPTASRRQRRPRPMPGGIAVMDAFIACWDAKDLSNLQRPVAHNQHNIDGTRLPYNVTPAHPDIYLCAFRAVGGGRRSPHCHVRRASLYGHHSY
jgi:hypothetical protein